MPRLVDPNNRDVIGSFFLRLGENHQLHSGHNVYHFILCDAFFPYPSCAVSNISFFISKFLTQAYEKYTYKKNVFSIRKNSFKFSGCLGEIN